MTYRGSGIPQVTLSPRADRMDTKRTVNPVTNLVYGRSGSYLQGTSPLCPVGGLLSILLEQVGCVTRHELVPLRLSEGG